MEKVFVRLRVRDLSLDQAAQMTLVHEEPELNGRYVSSDSSLLNHWK